MIWTEREVLEKQAELLQKNTATLQQLIDANIGQQVLVIKSREELMGGSGPGERSPVGQSMQYLLGIPEKKSEYDDKLHGILTIPMQQHMWCVETAHKVRWAKAQNPITICLTEIIGLGETLPLRGYGATVNWEDLKTGLDVIAGDLNVAAYFMLGDDRYMSVQRERKEGRLTDEQLKQRMVADGHLDVNYVLAVKELGAKPLPEMDRLLEDHKNYMVRAIYDTVFRNAAPAVAFKLNLAITLGMHKVPRTVELKDEGITVDVPEFIRSLCNRYDVEIPE